MYRVILAILMIGLWTPSFANTDTETLWARYSKAYMKKDCKTALSLLEQLIKIDPDTAYLEKAFNHEKGRCVPVSSDKAIEAYQMVPSEKMDSMFALNLTHLLFMKAQSDEDKQQTLSNIRDLLLDHMTLVNTAEELEKYVSMLYAGSPSFLTALKDEFDFFHALDAQPELKLAEIEKFIADEKYHSLSDFWLDTLRNEGNINAYLLSAKLFKDDLDKRKRFLSFAAKEGHPEAQKMLAQEYEAENTRASKMFAYYWNLKAKQNGVNVDSHLTRLRKSMSKSDIAVMEDEASKETPSLPF